MFGEKQYGGKCIIIKVDIINVFFCPAVYINKLLYARASYITLFFMTHLNIPSVQFSYVSSYEYISISVTSQSVAYYT